MHGFFIHDSALRSPVGWSRPEWFSTHCERNAFQYPRLTVPIAEPATHAVRADLDFYNDGDVVVVEIQSACRTEHAFEHSMFSKSAPHC